MNPDDINVLVMAIIVVSVILGFTIYFNNPSLNKAWSVQQQKDKGLAVVLVFIHLNLNSKKTIPM